MKLGLLFRPFVLALALSCGLPIVFATDACTPAQEQTIVREATALAPVAERIGCFVVRLLSTDGTLREVCVTADELTPIVEEIIQARKAASNVDAGGEPSADVASVEVRAGGLAFALEPPRRARARRHCVRWEHAGGMGDGGSRDASGD